jgi:dolichol-phosphate mannosyltransferase
MGAVPAVSIVIPAFNEEGILSQSIDAMIGALRSAEIGAEIIVVDDGSSDGTGSIADGFAARHPFIRSIHQENQGIGGAFRTGVAHAQGEYCMLWPADMVASRSDLSPYLSSLGKADVVVGRRRARVAYNPLMRLNAMIYPKLVFVLFGLNLRDVNWICAYRTVLLGRIELTQSGIPMLAEMLVRLRDLGAVLVEVEVDMRARAHGVPSAARFRIMRRTLAGLVRFWWQWRGERRKKGL